MAKYFSELFRGRLYQNRLFSLSSEIQERRRRREARGGFGQSVVISEKMAAAEWEHRQRKVKDRGREASLSHFWLSFWQAYSMWVASIIGEKTFEVENFANGGLFLFYYFSSLFLFY